MEKVEKVNRALREKISSRKDIFIFSGDPSNICLLIYLYPCKCFCVVQKDLFSSGKDLEEKKGGGRDINI